MSDNRCGNCRYWRHDGRSDMGACANQNAPDTGVGFILPIRQCVMPESLRMQSGNGIGSSYDSYCNLWQDLRQSNRSG